MAAEASISKATNLTGPAQNLVAERAYLELRDRIVTLRLAPGTALR